MKKATLLGCTTFGILLMAGPAVSAIPDSVWKNDTLFHDLWNKVSIDDTTTFWPHSTNWSVRYPGTDSAMIVTDGLARPSGANWTNLVWKYQSSPAQANVELRFTWRFENPASNNNSGFNMRGFCQTGTVANQCGGGGAAGYRVYGPQMDLGPTYTGNIYNSGNTTLNTAPAACRVTTATFQDLSYRIKNDTITMSYYPNGFDRPDTRVICTNPTTTGGYALTISQHLAANSPGLIALQYESQLRSNFKNIKIKNLDGVGGGTPVFNNGVKSLIKFDVVGARGSLELNVADAGRYSIQISDLNGAVVKNLHETSVKHQKINLSRNGVYFVRLSSAKGSLTRKVFVF